MKIVHDVGTGEVKAGDRNCMLRSSAIGSCIVVTAFDPVLYVGALAHIMLPGSAPPGSGHQTRYARQAVEHMLQLLTDMQAAPARLKCCLIGAANVLQRPDDTICAENLQSVEAMLNTHYLKIVRRAVGGMERRTSRFDIETGAVYYTRGNSQEMLLWRAER